SSISINGPFSLSTNCGSSVAASSSCSVNLTFVPTVGGDVSGLLTVTDASSKTYTAVLSGTGLDFSVSVLPASSTVVRGTWTTLQVYVNAVGAPFPDSVSLSCLGLPNKSTCSFSPPSVTPGSSLATSIMTITTSQGNTLVGTYSISVQGTSGVLSRL